MSEPVPASAVTLLLRAAAFQVSGGSVMFAAAACLRAGLDKATIVTMVCNLLDLTNPDPDLVATVLLSLPEFPETREA